MIQIVGFIFSWQSAKGKHWIFFDFVYFVSLMTMFFRVKIQITDKVFPVMQAQNVHACQWPVDCCPLCLRRVHVQFITEDVRQLSVFVCTGSLKSCLVCQGSKGQSSE